MENPKVKKGDKIILKKGNNGNKGYEGQTLEVTQERLGNHYIKVMATNKKVFNLYYSGPADVFVFAERKEQIKNIKEEIKEKKKELKTLQEELNFLIKYEDEEEFVAEKIDLLLKAKGKKAKAEILRELRKSNFL